MIVDVSALVTDYEGNRVILREEPGEEPVYMQIRNLIYRAVSSLLPKEVTRVAPDGSLVAPEQPMSPEDKLLVFTISHKIVAKDKVSFDRDEVKFILERSGKVQTADSYGTLCLAFGKISLDEDDDL